MSLNVWNSKVLIGILLSGTVFLFACNPSIEKIEKNRGIRIQSKEELKTLNPLSVSDAFSNYVCMLIYQPLLAIDYETNELVGVIAEFRPKIEVNGDLLKINYKIRKGAAFIGISIGSISSYYGDKELKINIIEIIIKTISLTIYLFVIFIIPWTQIEFVSIWFHLLLPFTVVFLVFYLAKKIGQKGILNKQLTLPVDLIIGRIIEIFESLPTLFILVALSTLISGSWLSISLIIGFTTWPNIAKFTRSEFLK